MPLVAKLYQSFWSSVLDLLSYFLPIRSRYSFTAQYRSFIFWAPLGGTIFLSSSGFSSAAFLFPFFRNAWGLSFLRWQHWLGSGASLNLWVALYKCSISILMFSRNNWYSYKLDRLVINRNDCLFEAYLFVFFFLWFRLMTIHALMQNLLTYIKEQMASYWWWISPNSGIYIQIHCLSMSF